MNIDSEEMEKLWDLLNISMHLKEKELGRELQIGEVADCICDVTSDKRQAVLLTSLFVFRDLHIRAKDGEFP